MDSVVGTIDHYDGKVLRKVFNIYIKESPPYFQYETHYFVKDVFHTCYNILEW